MKQGMTIQDAAKEIMRQSQAKADYLVNTANLHMETCDGIPILRLLDESGVDRVEPLDILTTAHRQMSAYLNIPWKYYERMRQEDIGLLAQNVNTWLRKGPEQRMIRTIDGRARAFLSNRYRRIDNIDIARITLPIIQQMPDAIYESCNLSDDYMFIKVVNPRLTAEVVPGDIVQAGVVISNSETGQGAVCVQPLIYRLVCSNGMTVNEARTRRNHIGRVTSADENLLIYSEATLRADDKAFVMKVQDTVRAAVDEARFTKILDKLRESKDKKLNTADLPGVVKLASSSMGITDAESEGVLQHLIEGTDYSLYGLANAVTRHSQDVESYDRASKLEEIGYQIITMSPALFQHINQTARMAA
ncbi:DUF932 domain-containing protein [uncultured Oscillibacter sp.]|uniref:DUF932 domain-containing protein n=1 Tax=uncultured Oscillibacter sp. TaxID=876091 RepID=UPI00260C42C2|nr:DUF932 domain-containing protein [uncultured Oscillibacter sp.]